MAKSMRCKRVKRLRSIKREMVEPYYEKKEAAKLAAQEAALAAPKLPIREKTNAVSTALAPAADSISQSMDLEMDDGTQANHPLKPVGGIGKKRKFNVGKGKRGGKGKFRIRRKNI